MAVTSIIAVIGFHYLTRGTAIRHVRGTGAENTPVSAAEPQFPLSVAMLTGAVLTRGTRVELALNGDQTFPRLFEDLRSARESITFQSYYGKPGRIADELRDIFLERAAAGVRVMVLYDAFGMNDMPPDNRKQLRRAGVQVVPFRPLRRSNLYVLQNRSHVRGVVIDGRIGWTGGFGIDDKSIAGARETLYITNAYFAPDRNFVQLLVNAARRGVDVRLILAGKRTDIRVARLAARARYQTLLNAGVRIGEWRPTTLHSKTFVVDGIWSSVGTMNSTIAHWCSMMKSRL